MKSNQKQRHQKNKHNQQKQPKLNRTKRNNSNTCCTTKWNHSNILKRTCCQEGKRPKKWNNFPCLLVGEWERKCKIKKKYFGTMLLPLLTWPISDPTVQKWFLLPRPFGTTFTVVAAKICRFSKTRLWSNPGAPPKNTKMRMGAPPEINFAIFLGPWFLGFRMAISRPETWKPHFPRSSGHVRTRLTTANLRLTWSQGAGPQVKHRNWFCNMPHCQHVAPRWRRIFLAALAITAALRKPTKHCKNRGSPPSDAAHPNFEGITGSILERIGKKTPHFRT